MSVDFSPLLFAPRQQRRTSASPAELSRRGKLFLFSFASEPLWKAQKFVRRPNRDHSRCCFSSNPRLTDRTMVFPSARISRSIPELRSEIEPPTQRRQQGFLSLYWPATQRNQQKRDCAITHSSARCPPFVLIESRSSGKTMCLFSRVATKRVENFPESRVPFVGRTIREKMLLKPTNENSLQPRFSAGLSELSERHQFSPKKSRRCELSSCVCRPPS